MSDQPREEAPSAAAPATESPAPEAQPPPHSVPEGHDTLGEGGQPRYTNRLAGSSSPYLRLHAHNPVDWYPWGEEAFQKARREGKPIFLSVGYSTCYWCHVMERESFSDPALAEKLNEDFVSIKVDREERPDVDDIYMLATQLMTGQGGWPNSVFLTPGLKPFYAGTYFPPADRWGRPGFGSLIAGLAHAWKTDRGKIEQQSEHIWSVMQAQRSAGTSGGAEGVSLPDPAKQLARAVKLLAEGFDPRWGGFGSAPKFPSPSNLHLLLEHHDRTGDERSLSMLTTTLDRMLRGGIYDQLGGGFHRYSTDDEWLVPHFEKMLYDNAFLSAVAVDAFERTGDPEFERVAREVLDWVIREMTGEDGGFYSAIDAETHAHEGAFYIWEEAELRRVLGKDGFEFLAPIYGFDGSPSFEGNAHVMHLPRPLSEVAREAGMSREDLLGKIALLSNKLFEARGKREFPLVDTKVLTDWNGMMIRAMARASELSGGKRFLAAARRAASLLERVARTESGRLAHVWMEGRASITAFLDDYAHLAAGYLELGARTGDRSWTMAAADLVAEADERLWDDEEGGYFFASSASDLILRSKEGFDGAIPAGNAVMAEVLVELARASAAGHLGPADEAASAGRAPEDYLKRAEGTLRAFAALMERTPAAVREMTVALSRYATAAEALGFESARSGGGAGPPSATTSPGVAVVEASPILLEAHAPPRAVSPGDLARVRLKMRLEERWHVNSDRPSQEFLFPTKVELGGGQDGVAVLERVSYPAARQVQLSFSKEPLSVYEGEVWFDLDLRLAGDLEGESIPVVIAVAAQPCNDRACLEPRSLELTLHIPLAP